ncbi:MAG: hypothetical protein GY810_25670 [Aureispira sp.]|nr:hypothetical protein [Aureispira sp.]
MLFVIAAVSATRDSKKIAENVAQRMTALETKYESYVEKYMTKHVLKDQNLEIDMDLLVIDVMEYLKPDVDGILALINSTIYSSVTLDCESEYFPNIVALSEDYFRQSQKNKSKRLSEEEVANFNNTLQDAVVADLKGRMLRLEMGDL